MQKQRYCIQKRQKTRFNRQNLHKEKKRKEKKRKKKENILPNPPSEGMRKEGDIRFFDTRIYTRTFSKSLVWSVSLPYLCADASTASIYAGGSGDKKREFFASLYEFISYFCMDILLF